MENDTEIFLSYSYLELSSNNKYTSIMMVHYADDSLLDFKALGRAAAEGFSKPIVQYCTPWKSEAKVPKIYGTLKFWFSAQDRTF